MPKKGENIYLRKDGRWEGRFIKGRSPQGKPVYEYCYGKSYREVRDKMNLAKARCFFSECRENGNVLPSLAVYCDEWLQIKRLQIKSSTYDKYKTAIQLHIKPALGSIPPESVTGSDIQRFSRSLLLEKKLSEKTICDVLTLLRSILNYVSAVYPEHAGNVRIFMPKVRSREARVLSRQEQELLIDHLSRNTDEGKFAILLGLYTGLRIGELCALRWSDVSLEDRIIRVASTMLRVRNDDEESQRRTKVLITTPKSARSVRIVPLTDKATTLCREHGAGRDPEAFVITGDTKRFMEPRLLQYRLRAYTRELGLEDVHFHTLRHTFATRCVEVDFEIKSLSEILGHASAQITLNRYVHSSVDLKRKNMDKLLSAGL